MNRTRKVRKSPVESATSMPEGTMLRGWVIKKASNGVPRWVPVTSASLNGFQLMTVDYAAKHIGKPITLYCREYKGVWPKKNAWDNPEDSTYIKLKFVPNGDGIKGKTRIPGWLKSRTPAIKKGMRFIVDGPTYECHTSKCDEYLADGLQVDSAEGKIASIDLMGTEVYVRS